MEKLSKVSFTDENLFDFIIQVTLRRVMCTPKTKNKSSFLSKSAMISERFFQLGKRSYLFFMLPEIKKLSSDAYVFLQDRA